MVINLGLKSSDSAFEADQGENIGSAHYQVSHQNFGNVSCGM